MKRDFTEEAKTTLFGLIDEINDEQSSSITDWLNNYSVFALADIEDDLGFMNAYYNKILYKNNTTKEQINTIFKNVNALDQTYASSFSAYNQDVQEQIDYIKALADCINPANVLFKSVDSIKKQMDSVHLSVVENNSFVKAYGFTYEQYVLIKKTFSKLEKYYKSKTPYINKVLNTIVPLCTRYNAMRWRFTTNGIDRVAAIKILKEAGLTNQEITDLFVIINVQHGDSIEKIRQADLSDIEEQGIYISKSKFLDMQKPVFSELNDVGKTKNEKLDFVHQLMQITEFSKDDTSIKSSLVDVFNSYYTDYEISFKGDIDSTSCGLSDALSDIDAINIYARMENKKHVFEGINDYYKGIYTGEVFRTTEFLNNLGNGDTKNGVNKLKDILEKWTPGSAHVSSDKDPKEIIRLKKEFVNLVTECYREEKSLQNKQIGTKILGSDHISNEKEPKIIKHIEMH